MLVLNHEGVKVILPDNKPVIAEDLENHINCAKKLSELIPNTTPIVDYVLNAVIAKPKSGIVDFSVCIDSELLVTVIRVIEKYKHIAERT